MIFQFATVVGLLGWFWLFGNLALKTGALEGEKPGGGHLAGVDGLRGLLALSVFVCHASCTRQLYVSGSWEAGGQILGQAGIYAVTMFFFITGFLFWTKLQRNPRPNLGAHFRSRIVRLGPAYWASFGVILLLVAVRSHGVLRESPGVLLKNIGSWLVFALPGEVDINGVVPTTRINAGVVWTLKLEWIFYALIPFCGWFAARFWRVGLFLLVLVGLRRGAMMMSVHDALPGGLRGFAGDASFQLFYLAGFFSGGIVVAAVRPWLRARFSSIDFRRPVFSVFVTGVVLATWFFGPSAHAKAVETVWLIVPFLLITMGNDAFGLLTSAPTLFLGKISYSIYLLHGIALYVFFLALNRWYPVAEIRAPIYWLIIAALGAGVIALSTLWHRWFEAPFMKPARVTTGTVH